MKNLVCLLSDQHVPNLLSVMDQQPDRLFLVETAGMSKKKAGENFKKALQNEKQTFTKFPQIFMFPVADENNLILLTQEFSQNLLGKFPLDQWIINLTGGTKLMSLAAFQAFQQAGDRQYIYLAVNNPNRIHYPLSGQSYLIENHVSMEAFLLGYGFEFSKKIEAIQMAEKEAKKRQALTNLIASKCAAHNFRLWGYAIGKLDFRNWLKRADHAKKPLPLAEDYLMPFDNNISMEIKKAFDLGIYPKGSLSGELSPFIIRYLDGGWLEEFVWNLLDSNRQALGITNVHLGVIIRHIETKTVNELDVSFIRNYGLSIVECKTGKQEDKMQGNQYKLTAIAANLKALRYSTFLVSNSPNLERIKERSELDNTVQVNAAAIEALAKEPNNIELIKSFLDKKK